MEERDTGLYKQLGFPDIPRGTAVRRSKRKTYAEDQQTSHDGGVLGVGDLIVGGADEALLGATGRNDNLLGRHDGVLYREDPVVNVKEMKATW